MPCTAASGGPGPGAGGAGGRVRSWLTHFPACVCQRPREDDAGKRQGLPCAGGSLVGWAGQMVVGRGEARPSISPLRPPVPHLGCPRHPFSRPQRALVWRAGLSLGSGQARVGATPLSARGPAVFQLSADGRATENWGRATGAPWVQLWGGQRDSVPGSTWGDLAPSQEGCVGGGRPRGGCQPLTLEVGRRWGSAFPEPGKGPPVHRAGAPLAELGLGGPVLAVGRGNLRGRAPGGCRVSPAHQPGPLGPIRPLLCGLMPACCARRGKPGLGRCLCA